MVWTLASVPLKDWRVDVESRSLQFRPCVSPYFPKAYNCQYIVHLRADAERSAPLSSILGISRGICLLFKIPTRQRLLFWERLFTRLISACIQVVLSYILVFDPWRANLEPNYSPSRKVLKKARLWSLCELLSDRNQLRTHIHPYRFPTPH